MRICILASQYPLPTETFVYESVRWLEAAGHDVRVVTDRRVGGPGLAEADYPATVPPARFAPREKLRRVLAHPIRVLAGASRARRLTASGTFSFAESLTRATLPEIRRSDFVVAHFGPAGARWLPAVAAARRRYAVFYHGFDASRHLQEHPHAYDGLIASRTAAFTNSDFLKSRLVAAGFDPARVAIVPYGVSDALDGRVARPPECGGQVLSIARLVAKKGLDDSIRAFARAQDVMQGGWRYRIVGEGHLLGELQALATSLGVEHLVEFSGTLPRGETLRALEGASVFLLTSKTGEAGDTEGTPVSILEAATLGLPIVTTIHAGIPELLPSDSARGMMLRPEGDVEGIATALRALARDPDLRRAWGGACGDFVRAGHSAQAHVAALLAALERFAEAPR
jgi:colanic acid/amylovoran biosynthesis glycosyltransferase